MENLRSHCRVCLLKPSEEDTLDVTIIYDEIKNLTYGECFAIIAGIDLKPCSENGPQILCKDCALELQISYDFKQKVAEANKILQPYLMKQQQVHDQPYDNNIGDKKQILQDVCILVLEGEQSQEYTIGCMTAPIEISGAIPKTSLPIEQNEEKHNGETVQELEYESIEELIVEEEEILDPSLIENSHANLECLKNNIDDNDTVPLLFAPVTLKTVETDRKIELRQPPVMKHPSSVYSCSYCDKKFPLYCRMISHQRIHEENRPKYPCYICKRSYASKQARRVHEQTVHDIEGAHVCDVCGKRFAILKLLEIHMRYHTGDFPFVCVQCGKKFAQRSHLETHKNVKHRSARFICTFKSCGKLFTSSSALRNHEFSHTSLPFECAQCKRGYPSKTKLKVHFRTKHGLDKTLDQLEEMRKFHVKRSKPNLVQITSFETHISEQ